MITIDIENRRAVFTPTVLTRATPPTLLDSRVAVLHELDCWRIVSQREAAIRRERRPHPTAGPVTRGSAVRQSERKKMSDWPAPLATCDEASQQTCSAFIGLPAVSDHRDKQSTHKPLLLAPCDDG